MDKQKKNALNMVEDWAEKTKKESNIMKKYLYRAYKKELQDVYFDVSEVWECIDSIADYASDIIGRVKDIKA